MPGGRVAARWPLAPETILGGCNARAYDTGAERDIVGRIIIRDTSDLTKRMSRKQREKTPSTCFFINSEEWFRDTIASWESPCKARTEKALAKRQSYQKRVLADYRERLRLAEEYRAETDRLREASGVNTLKERIDGAKAEIRSSALAISKAPARTIEGLRMKAEALKADDLVAAVSAQNGVLGDLAASWTPRLLSSGVHQHEGSTRTPRR